MQIYIYREREREREPLKHRFLCNCKDNDEDLFEISNEQFSSGYHQGREI